MAQPNPTSRRRQQSSNKQRMRVSKQRFTEAHHKRKKDWERERERERDDEVSKKRESQNKNVRPEITKALLHSLCVRVNVCVYKARLGYCPLAYLILSTLFFCFSCFSISHKSQSLFSPSLFLCVPHGLHSHFLVLN